MKVYMVTTNNNNKKKMCSSIPIEEHNFFFQNHKIRLDRLHIEYLTIQGVTWATFILGKEHRNQFMFN